MLKGTYSGLIIEDSSPTGPPPSAHDNRLFSASVHKCRKKADRKNVKSFLELPSARGVFCSDAGTLFYNQLMIVRCRRVNLLNYCFATTVFRGPISSFGKH